MWELDHRKGWVPKNRCFQTVVLENTLENPLVSKGIKLVNPKGNQHWIFIGRIDAEAEAPKVWPPDVKSRLIGKDPDAGKDWRQKEKRVMDDEMVGWHHWLSGPELGETPGDSEEQGGLVCCSWRGCRVRHDLATEQQHILIHIISIKDLRVLRKLLGRFLNLRKFFLLTLFFLLNLKMNATSFSCWTCLSCWQKPGLGKHKDGRAE